MEKIEISEDTGRPNGAVLRLSGYNYPITVTPPFDAKQEGELNWYFEEHLRFPFTDEVRALDAGKSVKTYGHALFGQLFDGSKVRERYGKLKEKYPDGLTFEIIGPPSFQGLHWEALWDPDLPRPFSLDVSIVRRGTAEAPPFEGAAADSPTLTLLVVTARPSGAQDVGYRTITRPLIDTLRQAQLRVDVDLVRPGTWKALAQALEATGAGHYHAIHFDLHGALLTYEDSQAKATRAHHRLTFDRFGRGEIAPYQGSKAYLSFEQEEGEGTDLAEAGEVADLLLRHRIPICVLNACQSGKQVGADETSLGARLLQAGIHSVVAMAWSVTVTAAERMIPVLYRELFAGRDLGRCLHAARRELWNEKGRRAAFNETIRLEDWVLPVVYQNREPKLAFRAFTPEEATRWNIDEAAIFPEPATEYGFFGRDLDMLRIEKALLVKRNILLVQGMGGSGKTTLLQHLAHWQQRTGLVEQAFYFGWDSQAWTAGQILRELAPKVLPADMAAAFDALHEAAQQAAVAKELRAKRHLLILDNLESITAASLAIPHRLDKAQQDALRGFLVSLVGGKTLVLLGSRIDEGWLAKGTFEQNRHVLEGLDPEAADNLADAVLKRVGARERRREQSFSNLMRLLGGYPLALRVVLPNLAKRPAAEVLAALQQGLPEIDAAAGGDVIAAKTQSLLACIDYSHGNLDAETQALLLCFAPFKGWINRELLHLYIETLSAEHTLNDLEFDKLDNALETALSWGLMSKHTKTRMYILPHPLLAYFLSQELDKDHNKSKKSGIESAFYKFHFRFCEIAKMEQESQIPTKSIVAHEFIYIEYVNIIAALDIGIKSNYLLWNLYQPVSNYFMWRHWYMQGIEIGRKIFNHFESFSLDKLSEIQLQDILYAIGDYGNRLQALGRVDESKIVYDLMLPAINNFNWIDQRWKYSLLSGIHHSLGMNAATQGDLRTARLNYILAINNSRAYSNREGVYSSFFQLGRVAQDQRK